MDLIIITGMSGAGKSQAMNALEDMGYYCVDNVPPGLIVKFAEIPNKSGGKIEKIALGVDVRSKDMFADYLSCLEEIKELEYEFKTVFLECDAAVLSKRYKETRRRHPLLSEKSITIADAIKAEHEILAPALLAADYIIDTSIFSVTQLKTRIRELFADEKTNRMVVTCMSFGFKHGLPVDSDLVFDVRCLPNPFYLDELREQVGTDKPVEDFVLSFDTAKELFEKLSGMLDFLIPLYVEEGKSQLVISFGCSGGRHRSVVFAEKMAQHLSAGGVAVNKIHRDIIKR